MSFKDTLHIPALGRIQRLGEFYDARKEAFTGFNIFSSYPEGNEIQLFDISDDEINFVTSDTITDKLESMDISPELSISVLSGMIELEGSGKYLLENKKSIRNQRMHFLYSVMTMSEQAFLPSLKGKIDFDLLDSVDATHLVIGVEWGARCIISCECEVEVEGDLNEDRITDMLNAKLNNLKCVIDTNSKIQDVKQDDQGIGIKFNYSHMCDIPNCNCEILSSFQHACDLSKQFRSRVEELNDGKGVPMTYVMASINSVSKMLKTSRKVVLKRIDEDVILKSITFMEHIISLRQTFRDLSRNLIGKEKYVPDAELEKINLLINEFDLQETKFKSGLAATLTQVRCGFENPSKIEELLASYAFSAGVFSKIESCIDDHLKIYDKLRRIKKWGQNGIIYLGKNEKIKDILVHNCGMTHYVLCLTKECSETDYAKRSNNIQYFLRLNATYIKDREVRFVVADCDIEPFPTNTTILHYVHDVCLTDDVLRQKGETLVEMCVGKLTDTKAMEHISIARTIVQLPCPNSFNGPCPPETHLWNCIKCRQRIDYAVDDKCFYCKCGQSKGIKFRCSDVEHGIEFTQYPEEDLVDKLSKLPLFKELNILVLGETGVGKSTWLNAIANYFWFDTLESATKEDFFTLIQSQFTMTDDKGDTRTIFIGDVDENENLEQIGQSVTQNPTSYSIYIPKDEMVIRFIDTPGIGDTRGIDQDKKNFQNILSHISYLKELHGICILLKPNDSRLTTMFRFCINELLTHLHRSAARNMVFCFTNARATMYRPGESKTTLQKLIDANKHTSIQLTKEICYSFDNEAFRFLACLKNGIQFSAKEIEDYGASWETAAAETIRMINYISKLQPHAIHETISLNSARNIILTLSKPLAQICQTIQKNILEAKDKKDELNATTMSKEDLMSKLELKGIDLEMVSLDYPRTVCTHVNCVKYIKVGQGETQKTWYKQQCHPHCYLSGVPTGVVNNVLLKSCRAMGGNQDCTVCGHSWTLHMHLTYDMKEIPKTFIDVNTQKLVDEKKTTEENIKDFIKKIDEHIDQLTYEQTQITNISAQFGCFLKANAITPFNDAIIDHIKCMISLENGKQKPDTTLIASLHAMQGSYTEQHKIIAASMTDKANHNVPIITGGADVKVRRNDLFQLKINGPSIERLFKDIDQQNRRVGQYRVRQFAPTERKRQGRIASYSAKKGEAWYMPTTLTHGFRYIRNYWEQRCKERHYPK